MRGSGGRRPASPATGALRAPRPGVDARGGQRGRHRWAPRGGDAAGPADTPPAAACGLPGSALGRGPARCSPARDEGRAGGFGRPAAQGARAPALSTLSRSRAPLSAPVRKAPRPRSRFVRPGFPPPPAGGALPLGGLGGGSGVRGGGGGSGVRGGAARGHIWPFRAARRREDGGRPESRGRT